MININCEYYFSVLMLKMGQVEAESILMDPVQGSSYNLKTCRSGENPFFTKMIPNTTCPLNPHQEILPSQVKLGKFIYELLNQLIKNVTSRFSFNKQISIHRA